MSSLDSLAAPDPHKPIYEDNHVLVWFKAAGLACQGGEGLRNSLDEKVKRYLKEKYHKQGNVYLGLVHRIDRPTAGLVVMGKTSKAASRLSEQFRNRAVNKRYWAVVEGGVSKKKTNLQSFITSNRGSKKHRRVNASLNYRKLPVGSEHSLLEIDLETGRKHQIRRQLSQMGNPVIGDFKYGSHVRFKKNAIALMAVNLEFQHPTLNKKMSFSLPEDFCLEYLGILGH